MPSKLYTRSYSPRPTKRTGPEPTMLRPEVSAISTTSLASSTSTKTTSTKSSDSKSKQQFFDLPPDIRVHLITASNHLANHLQRITQSGRLKATDVLPIGREILDLSALCCIINCDLLHAIPDEMELERHVRQALQSEVDGVCCPCCGVMDMMDLEGEVLHSFPDDGDEAVVGIEVQKAALLVIIREVNRAVEGVCEVLSSREQGTRVERKIVRKRSLDNLVRGLRGMFSRGSRVQQEW